MRPARTLACVTACVALATAATQAPAQTSRTIRGTVESAEHGEPLAGALLRSLAPGSPTLATSSETGAFSLTGRADQFRLLVARIGFVPDTVLVPSGQETIVVRLRPTVVELDTLTVTGRADDLIGIASSASQGRVGGGDLRSRPIAREGELLETVPGVIVTQHSGDGKANQYFIRGFNLDHGTDFATRFEGMPVNMVSHAHGQGYTDLNFLIPELVDHLDYKLGVYHTELGDFGSAGGAEFHLARSLPRPFAGVSGGEHGLARLVAGASNRLGAGDLLLGGEVKRYDGPWALDEEIRKYSGVARYSWSSGRSEFSILGTGYQNTWNSSDQIPSRAIRSGLIGRFGNIDPTDGGDTRRYSLSGSWRRNSGRAVQEAALHGIYSDLSLFSNFAYFLTDPDRGDQFNQREDRVILGGSASHRQLTQVFGVEHRLKIGVQTRADFIYDLGLHLTSARARIGTLRQDDVREWGTGLFVEAESEWRPWLRSVLGLRGDYYDFDVSNSSIPANAGHRTAGIVSPKASLILAPSAGTEVYLSGGFSFHSNDARGTTITVDPLTGDPVDRVDPLVRSRGAEVGVRLTPLPRWRSTVSAWGLELDGELLFVGDAGITEPSFPSHRVGLTLANFYRPVPELALDLDISLARARFDDVPAGEDRIPGAIENVVAAGVAWTPAGESGPFGAVRLRHFGTYPLIEDNSVRAGGTTLLGAEAGYQLASGIRLEASVLNLLNARSNDIEYYYASRLPGEPADGVEDIHLHPVEPRQVRVMLAWGL
ncbi:MAG TPA: TonB-dependent receptor [Gemmatimonadales bacterium]|nr:TonB-dependent receptor [Gemmatimonadales bacterium]